MGLFDFFSRHRNKILLAGGAVGSVVVIKKILADYEKQWQESSSRGFVHEARKKEIHFENIINECNQLCQRMSSKLIKRLQVVLNDSQLIEELTSKRGDKKVQSKVETWKLLKVKILTKLISEIYCICILVCSMRVQMSIIGGQVFARSTQSSTSNSGSSSASVADLTHMRAYTKYVALLGSFYDQKFDCLIQPIEDTIDETLRGYTMDYLISIQDFKTILDKIKRSISFFLSSPNSKTSIFLLKSDKLSSFAPSSSESNINNLDQSSPINQEEESLSAEDEKALRDMLDETQDILESGDFKQVLESSIEVGYAILLDSLLGAFIKMESKINSKDDNNHQSGFSNPNAIQVPLVRILSQIRNNHLERSPADQKVLVNHLLCLDVLNCFAANVYEAFCIPKQ